MRSSSSYRLCSLACSSYNGDSRTSSEDSTSDELLPREGGLVGSDNCRIDNIEQLKTKLVSYRRQSGEMRPIAPCVISLPCPGASTAVRCRHAEVRAGLAALTPSRGKQEAPKNSISGFRILSNIRIPHLDCIIILYIKATRSTEYHSKRLERDAATLTYSCQVHKYVV